MPYDNANGVVDKFFVSLRSRYQIRLETSKGGSDFIFNSVYKSDKINFKHDGATVASNQEKIEWHLEVVSNIKPFVNNYNWEGINYPSKIEYWKSYEKNNSTISLHIFYINEQ